MRRRELVPLLAATLTSARSLRTQQQKTVPVIGYLSGPSAERCVVYLNALIDEALNLAYHGARAQDQSFNITLERDFDGGVAPVDWHHRILHAFCSTCSTMGSMPPADANRRKHGGSITVASKVGEYSEFTIRLPGHS